MLKMKFQLAESDFHSINPQAPDFTHRDSLEVNLMNITHPLLQLAPVAKGSLCLALPCLALLSVGHRIL